MTCMANLLAGSAAFRGARTRNCHWAEALGVEEQTC